MKCPRCQQENPPQAKFCLECGAAVGATRPPLRSSQETGAEIEGLRRSLSEALEQQAATSEILKVISSSSADVQPVFETILERAVALCGARHGTLLRFDRQLLHAVAHHDVPPAVQDLIARRFLSPPDWSTAAGRAILTRQVATVEDTLADERYEASAASAGGFRSLLSVPLLRDGDPIGVITIVRSEPGRFSGKQIALLETFAHQAVIAIENVRLFNETKEALEQQTATAEILRVISQSPTDVQPVFDTIAANARRLCNASSSAVFTFDGELIHLAAQEHMSPQGAAVVRGAFPMPPGRGSTAARAIMTRSIAQITEAREDPEYVLRDATEIVEFRSVLAVPMLRDGHPIGAVSVGKAVTGPFPDKQIALLQTFADQAVIAIENVRLFTELQEKNRALTEAHAQVTEALDQQMATSEILRAISSSHTDLQPVFDAILQSAGRLCDATFGALQLFDGEHLTLDGHYGISPEDVAMLQAHVFPMRPDMGSSIGRAIIRRATIHIEDIRSDPEFKVSALQTREGYRTALSVPMLRGDIAIGVINLWRREVRPFSQTHIDMVQTFAHQAVIAIENVRLFTELQTSNRDLTTALDQQTATSEILRFISGAHTDAQPVFDSIVRSAARLLEGHSANVLRVVGDELQLAALTAISEAADAETRATFPVPLVDAGVVRHAIRTRRPYIVTDVETDSLVTPRLRYTARLRGFRSMLMVPMVHQAHPVGVITVTRQAPGGYSEDEVALLQTFADQAVIAIENVRLFKELEARTQELTRSVGELRALGEVGQAISSTLDLRTVLTTIVARATQLSSTDAGVIYEYDEQREVFVPRATAHLEADIVETMLATPVRRGEGATGRLAERQEPIQVPDILAAPAESRVRGALVRAGYRALLAVPLVRDDHLLGGLTVIRKATGAFAPEVIELLTTFATQSVLAIQNARLFREIADKSRQLEVASQHKSEFLANMSHELRTPLNAIIGFSEVLSERMFGELNEKQEEYLKDIHASGQHLLSLINDILDLSKIEAGRMELELTDFDLPATLDNALILVRERAGRRGITLHTAVDERLGQVRADERKIRQVALNLLSNAIKFTPEGGRIEVRAVPKDGSVEVSVSDTGVGIAPEDQEAVFEEFRQVGTAETKAEGTGLGLTLCRKFVEVHGGRIWVKSEVGVGSTFSFTIPVKAIPKT